MQPLESPLGTSQAVRAVVVADDVRRRQCRERAIIACANDLVDLALRLLVVQIVDFHFGRARIAEIALAIHMACIASHGLPPF